MDTANEEVYRSRGDKVKDWLAEKKLRNQWMIEQLAARGFKVSPSYFCHIMTGRLQSDYAMLILAQIEQIIAKYNAEWEPTDKPSA